MKKSSAALAVTVLTIGASACGQPRDDTNLVARAGDYELSVDDVVALLADQERLPVQTSVVESLVDLWIDYTLLAEAAADDTTFATLDLAALVRQRLDQEMVFQLRDSVLQVDTAITPDELRALYADESPDLRMRARHILLTYPLQATPTQRDSVRRQLEGLRARILAGERFEDIARSYSQDRGTASAGGDLGFFGRGDMVSTFEDAVLTLDPGEISDVVETPMGLHVIRLEELRARDFEEVASEFRSRVQAARTAAAESAFVARLEDRSGPEVAEGAFDVARELATNPGTRLSRRAARRDLISWEGGGYTAGELQELLQFEQPGLRQRVAEGTDEELGDFLHNLARRDLLVAEARRSGLEPPRARLDSLVSVVRGQLLAGTRALGLLDLDQAPGEAREIAVTRVVRQALVDNLSGATRIMPLGLVGFQLRERVPISIFSGGVGQSLIRLGQVRAARGLSPLEANTDTVGVPEDTVVR